MRKSISNHTRTRIQNLYGPNQTGQPRVGIILTDLGAASSYELLVKSQKGEPLHAAIQGSENMSSESEPI